VNIGILALQGDFARHAQMVQSMGHTPLFVRYPQELAQCDKLIIPGGESTTLLKLIEKNQMRDVLSAFGERKAIMGTCAGLIILSNDAPRLPYKPLGLIDINVDRNAYGRQIDSFVDQVQITLDGVQNDFTGVFIRAPKIKSVGAEVNVLGRHGRDIVLAATQHILVATFHPELTDDTRIHEYFLKNMG